MDAYLIYASIALVVLAVAALGMSFVFRRRHKHLDNISQSTVATVFSRTFTVFDPYSPKTIVHRFLSMLPFVPLILGWCLAVLLLVIIDAGLLLTLLVTIVGLSLIVVEESVEALAESKTLIRSIEDGTSLGVGDLRLLSVTKSLLPRLSRYYLGLSASLLVLAGIIPFVWVQSLYGFALFLSLFIEMSAVVGPIGWLIGIALYAGGLTALFFLVAFAKTRVFGGRVDGSAEVHV